jgi:hypothetical protein
LAGSGKTPEGQIKAKISVSVDQETLTKALAKWGGKQSPWGEKPLQDNKK